MANYTLNVSKFRILVFLSCCICERFVEIERNFVPRFPWILFPHSGRQEKNAWFIHFFFRRIFRKEETNLFSVNQIDQLLDMRTRYCYTQPFGWNWNWYCSKQMCSSNIRNQHQQSQTYSLGSVSSIWCIESTFLQGVAHTLTFLIWHFCNFEKEN